MLQVNFLHSYNFVSKETIHQSENKNKEDWKANYDYEYNLPPDIHYKIDVLIIHLFITSLSKFSGLITSEQEH